MDKWISHFHCSDCEQCIDIDGKDLINSFESTIEDDSDIIQVYKCPVCSKTIMVVVECNKGKRKFKKFLKGTTNEQMD